MYLNGLRQNIDFVVFRENTEGIYVNVGGNLKRGTDQELAIQEEINTRYGVERIIRAAFAYAREHGRKRVTLADKSNVLTHGHELWGRVFKLVAAELSTLNSQRGTHRVASTLNQNRKVGIDKSLSTGRVKEWITR